MGDKYSTNTILLKFKRIHEKGISLEQKPRINVQQKGKALRRTYRVGQAVLGL